MKISAPPDRALQRAVHLVLLVLGLLVPATCPALAQAPAEGGATAQGEAASEGEGTSSAPPPTPGADRETTGVERPPDAPEPFDPLGRDSPRGTLYGYLLAAREADFEKAAAYLDLSRVPRGERALRGPDLAWKLKIVLDNKLWIELDRLSAAWDGNDDDGLRARRDRFGILDTQAGDVELLVARVPERIEGQPRPVWKISADTVSRIDDLYATYGIGRLGVLVQQIPAPLREPFFLELALWQWAGIAIVLVIAFLLASLVTALLRSIVPRLLVRQNEMLRLELSRALGGPLRLILFSLFTAAGDAALILPIPGQRAVGLVVSILLIIGVAWLVFRLIDHLARTLDTKAQAGGGKRLRGLIALGSSITKGVFLGLAIIVILQNAGINVSGVLAGVGIGGLALSFGAQKTIENLFGGVSVIADEPVSVGDFCRFGTSVGTVERIGLRSTWIRTLDRTMLSVPNSVFSSNEVENYALRDKIRLHAILNLRYETTPDQLRFVLARIRELLAAHAQVDPDPARVRFVAFGAHSLDVEIFAYITTTEWPEFLAIREDIYLRIMDIVAEAGAGFAFPSQTLYLGRDEKADPERIAAAEKQIAEWRSSGKLPFPDYGADDLARLDDTIEYPPEGSARGSENADGK